MAPEIHEDEQLHELNRGGNRIIQKISGFRFGTDAVLLSDFTLIKPGARVMDFGAGTGIISLLCAIHRADIRVTALELQPDMADMAQRSVQLNRLEDRISVRALDLRLAAENFGYGAYDNVICNPPYHDLKRGLKPENENRLLSRTESSVTIDEICLSAFRVLKSGGRLSVIYPAMRLHEMLRAMQDSRLSPKRVRCVQQSADRPPKLILIDAVKHGGSQLEWLPPLILAEEDGSPSKEWHRIYD